MASRYININIHTIINTRDIISTKELLMILKCTTTTIIKTGTHIITQEFNKNLSLITHCLNNHLKVSPILENARLML